MIKEEGETKTTWQKNEVKKRRDEGSGVGEGTYCTTVRGDEGSLEFGTSFIISSTSMLYRYESHVLRGY